jgi:pyruvate dehydrogenase complex dehydrogenase (E1) component
MSASIPADQLRSRLDVNAQDPDPIETGEWRDAFAALTGSLGIGPISSFYHARFMRYLTDRRLLDCSGRKVWGVFGDGEMDEPESMSALTLAAREKLDNLVWVVNCNLQRLDGPVRGNGGGALKIPHERHDGGGGGD